ncbi:hypothetical protein DFH09DRAFT_567145 [Mycena vulgaris]|nr:hypothetical protein DFH09DRAFT_567145 [Mycena vulgaris]
MPSLLAFFFIAGRVQPLMASDSLYRLYNTGGCNHAPRSLPANTSPPTGTAAYGVFRRSQGKLTGSRLRRPTGTRCLSFHFAPKQG